MFTKTMQNKLDKYASHPDRPQLDGVHILDGTAIVTDGNIAFMYPCDGPNTNNKVIDNLMGIINRQHYATTVLVSNHHLEIAVKSANALARDGSKAIKITVNGRMSVTGECEWYGSTTTDLVDGDPWRVKSTAAQRRKNIITPTVPVMYVKEGEDTRAAFNSRYLLDILAFLDSDTVEIALSGEDGPAIFSAENGRRVVVMPMNVWGD